MKTVELATNFDYCPDPHITIRFHAGITYRRVIEAAALAIVCAGAGRVVETPSLPGDAAGLTVDARHAFTPRHRRR